MIPRTISTQHPDNAKLPNWTSGEVLEGEDEVEEAYLAYKRFGCQEVMWDAEGKDADAHVIRKLLLKYPSYFKKHVLGKDIFLTYRLPNPRLEKTERKVLMETLDHIPLSQDVAYEFYGNGATPPIFEAIMPFTQYADDLIATAKYYELAVAGKEEIKIYQDLTVKDWLGEVKPETINVIPLFEDEQGLINAGAIVETYFNAIKPTYVRGFIGRSDPAMSYGLTAAVLLSKIAISSLNKTEKIIHIPVYPIIGVGSLPFRGGMNPHDYRLVLKEYPDVYTFTIQSAFKYDYEEGPAKEAILNINSSKIGDRLEISDSDVAELIQIIDKLSKEYKKEVAGLSTIINKLSTILPPRRARKPHTGLFGYGRKSGSTTLPRAIVFTAALYSIGFPPEFLGLRAISTLSGKQWELVLKYYVTLHDQLRTAANFFSWDSYNTLKEEGVWGLKLPQNLIEAMSADLKQAGELGIDLGARDYYGMKHSLFSFMSIMNLNQGRNEEGRNHIMEAARVRKSLG